MGDVNSRSVERWNRPGGFSDPVSQNRYYQSFHPVVMAAEHVRVIDGAFFWPEFNDLLYDDNKNLHMGRMWLEDPDHPEKCFGHWAWGLQRICAYANACSRDFTEEE